LSKIIIISSLIVGLSWLSSSFTLTLAGGKEKALPKLSDYGLFEGALTEMVPNENVHPYDLNTPLFSDYAKKVRFIYLPEGTSMNWQDVEVFDMPVGAIIVKHFYYSLDERKPDSKNRFIETRILKNTDNGWKAWGYWWNKDQTDAEYKALGGKTDISWVDAKGNNREVKYESPNQFQCKSCHSFNGKIKPIGPAARQLHGGEVDYVNDWVESGILKGAPADKSSWPIMNWNAKNATVATSARAYLDANCGYCHRHEGPASTSGLFLHDKYETGPKTGVMKSPVAAGKGSGGRKYDILPGKPEKSILYYRMKSNDAAVRMPEVGRSIAHEEGLEIVRNWILEMEK